MGHAAFGVSASRLSSARAVLSSAANGAAARRRDDAPRWPKLADFIVDSEADVLAYTTFPSQHRTKLHFTNPLERLDKEVKRRADVVGIFPTEESIVRLIGAVLLESNDDWQLQHRYMQIVG